MSDKRRLQFAGMSINVETEIGDERSGVGEDGKTWRHVYEFPYGEVDGTQGADGDPIDVYLGPTEDAPMVFVIHQNFLAGSYDEDKVMLGFLSEQAAVDAYQAHGPVWGFGGVEPMTLEEFKRDYVDIPRMSGPPMTVPGMEAA